MKFASMFSAPTCTYGDTSGGTVNITTKSGTNQFHGSGRWSYQAAGCSSLDGTFISRAAQQLRLDDGASLLRKPSASARPRRPHFNQFGGTIGGPIWIPKVFNGRNKLFFFYAYETYRGQQPPAQTTGDVPTAAERAGDFSALLDVNRPTQSCTISTIRTRLRARTSYTQNSDSQQLPGPRRNRVFQFRIAPPMPDSLSIRSPWPISSSVPLPNYTGATTMRTARITTSPSRRPFRITARTWAASITTSAPRTRSSALRNAAAISSTASNYFHDALTGTDSDQIMAGGQIEEIHTFSPTLFSDVRGSVTRYDNSNDVSSTGISPTSSGLSRIPCPEFHYARAIRKSPSPMPPAR